MDSGLGSPSGASMDRYSDILAKYAPKSSASASAVAPVAAPAPALLSVSTSPAPAAAAWKPSPSASVPSAAATAADASDTTGAINNLKSSLINASAELMISKTRIDDLTRDREKVLAQVSELQAALAAKDAELRMAAGAQAEARELRAALARVQNEASSKEDRVRELMSEVHRERGAGEQAEAGLRNQVTALQAEVRSLQAQLAKEQRELEEAHAAAASRHRSAADMYSATQRQAQAQLEAAHGAAAELRAQLAAAAREKDDVTRKLDLALRTIQDRDAAVEALRRDVEVSKREVEEARSRVTAVAREADADGAQAAATIAGLQKLKSELQNQLAAQESTISSLKNALDAMQVGKGRAEADTARVASGLEAANAERERLVQRWRAAEERAAEAEATITKLKTALAEAQQETQLAATRAMATASLVSTNAAIKGGNTPAPATPSAVSRAQAEELSSALETETAIVVSLRKSLREIEAEKEAVRDILASIYPLPDFVRERAAEAEGSYVSTGAVSTSGELSASGVGASPAKSMLLARSTAAAVRRISLAGSNMAEASNTVQQLRALALERPMVIDALTYMDRQLRTLRVEKERAESSLESARSAEASYEASVQSLRRQVTSARQENAALSDDKDRLTDKLARCDAELKARVADLASAREVAAEEASKGVQLQRALEEARAALGTAREEADQLRARIEAVRADADNQLAMERAMKEQLMALHAADTEKAAQAHQQQVSAMGARLSALEGELEGTQHELETTANRLASISSELEKARGDVQHLQSVVVQLDTLLGQRDGKLTETLATLRDTEAARVRTAAQLEQVTAERDETLTRVASLAGEMQLLRSRISELEARELQHRDDEQRIASLAARLADTETALAQAQAASQAAENRVVQVREQARVDIEMAQQATSRMTAELQRVQKARDDDAEAAATMAAASRRAQAQMQAELESVSGEAEHLRDRCRSLQEQVSELVGEVHRQSEMGRQYHDDAMKAKSDLQSAVESSHTVHRALLEQLNNIKADFYSFLSLFHPDAANAGAGAGAEGNAHSLRSGDGGLTVPRSPAAKSLISTLGSDMAELKKRLEALAASKGGHGASADALAATAGDAELSAAITGTRAQSSYATSRVAPSTPSASASAAGLSSSSVRTSPLGSYSARFGLTSTNGAF